MYIVQTPYLVQIWHATVTQWSMLTRLISCVAHVGQKRHNAAISTKFSHFGGSCVHPPLPIQAKFGRKR